MCPGGNYTTLLRLCTHLIFIREESPALQVGFNSAPVAVLGAQGDLDCSAKSSHTLQEQNLIPSIFAVRSMHV